MPRIKGRTSEQTRSSVLNAASRTFSELGYDGASLSRIARRAGVTAATLCYHFKDKQGLYDAVVDDIYRELLKLPMRIDHEKSFADIVDQIYAFAEEHREGIRLLIRQIMEVGGITHRVRERHVTPVLSTAARLLAARLDVDERDARRSIIAMTHLVTRFVTNAPEDNRIALGVKTNAEAREEIVDILVSTGQHLLGLTPARLAH